MKTNHERTAEAIAALQLSAVYVVIVNTSRSETVAVIFSLLSVFYVAVAAYRNSSWNS